MARDPAAAARITALVLIITGVLGAVKAVAALLLFDTVLPSGAPSTPAEEWMNTVFLPITLVVLGEIVRRLGPRVGTAQGWLIPMGALTMLAAVNITNDSAGAGSQMFAVFATIVSAYHLRPAMSAVVTAYAAVLAIVVDLWVGNSGGPASMPYFLTALIAMTVVVSLSRHEAAAAEDTLAHQASVDHLTGACSRLVLDEHLARAFARGDVGLGVGVVVFDVDHFKGINDRFGHPVGDAVLAHLTDIVRRNARDEELVARMGGDEFALLMVDAPRAEVLYRARQIVADARTNPARAGDVRAAFTLSAGVAHAPADADSVEALYAAADRSLYVAKQQGRDQVGPSPAP